MNDLNITDWWFQSLNNKQKSLEIAWSSQLTSLYHWALNPPRMWWALTWTRSAINGRYWKPRLALPGMICRIEPHTLDIFGYRMLGCGISALDMWDLSKRCDSKKVMRKKVPLTELWFGEISSKTDLGIVQNCVPPNLHGFIMFI